MHTPARTFAWPIPSWQMNKPTPAVERKRYRAGGGRDRESPWAWRRVRGRKPKFHSAHTIGFRIGGGSGVFCVSDRTICSETTHAALIKYTSKNTHIHIYIYVCACTYAHTRIYAIIGPHCFYRVRCRVPTKIVLRKYVLARKLRSSANDLDTDSVCAKLIIEGK